MFWNAFPFYLSCGMSEDQYWNGDPYLTVSYREASRTSLESRNYDMWWQGFYIYEAFETVIYNALRGKKEAKTYPKEPFRITPETEQEKQDKVEKARKDAIDQLNRLKEKWDTKNGR